MALATIAIDGWILFQSLKGFQRFCGSYLSTQRVFCSSVSIPKRVSEVLWPYKFFLQDLLSIPFQSLKGFQRFCGVIIFRFSRRRDRSVSIPKRVSEVLWL